MYFAKEAKSHGVTGWVRNRRDGTVEATVQGAAENVERIIEWARHGPPNARVTDLQVREAEGTFDGFDVKATE